MRRQVRYDMIAEDYPRVEDNIMETPRGSGLDYIQQIALPLCITCSDHIQ
jgi:hypothetical protein